MKNDGKKNIVIIGGSFAGLTAAYKIKRESGDRSSSSTRSRRTRRITDQIDGTQTCDIASGN
jgi:hypothetical protein